MGVGSTWAHDQRDTPSAWAIRSSCTRCRSSDRQPVSARSRLTSCCGANWSVPPATRAASVLACWTTLPTVTTIGYVEAFAKPKSCAGRMVEARHCQRVLRQKASRLICQQLLLLHTIDEQSRINRAQGLGNKPVWHSMSALVVGVGVLAAGFEQQRVADVVREQLHRIVLGCGARRSHVRRGLADESPTP